MKAHELLVTPDKWTQDVYCRDKDGEGGGMLGSDPGAVSWCLTGAIDKCYPALSHKQRENILNKIRTHLGRNPIAWNDAPERTHAEVLAVLKELDI